MSLLFQLKEPRVWERFCEYKTSLVCPDSLKKELRKFIDDKAYLPVCERIEKGERFPLPKKSVISKLGTQKKRVVYTYPYAENMVTKLLTYLLLRKYDGLFANNLFSFRPGRTAKDALLSLLRRPGIGRMYSYKVDVSNYFNSIDISLFLPELEAALSDPPLFAFLKGLLCEPLALDRGRPVEEQKGIMAGTPLASFFANLFLRELDLYFESLGVPYARYSDDIILFANTREEAVALAETVRTKLSERRLAVNPAKESFTSPEEGFVFLGFSYKSGVIDVAPASVVKLKQKMRRKTRALARWRDRNGLDGEKAAKAFIRVFNRKLFENPADNELTWTYWFFPVITTAESLRVIDRYAQDCVRVLISGRRTKARFNVRYEDMKALGYRSLVHSYYDFSEEERERRRHGKE
ncbi:MAG: hypothetical protein K6G56_07285 [Clostridiales bacterium]|nr:hypothetical protein [Clostridiales bacterium]